MTFNNPMSENELMTQENVAEIQRLYDAMIQVWVDSAKHCRGGDMKLSKSGRRRMAELRDEMLSIEKGVHL